MKKIAVMLPVGYRGGSLRGAKNIAKAIVLAARQKNEAVQVVFSYVKEGKYDLHADFDDLRECGISLRETAWQLFSHAALEAVIPLLDYHRPGADYGYYCLPVDGASDFHDCDLWVIISDRLPAPLFPLRKYICVIYDYLQRYVPGIFGEADILWLRQEESLFPLVRNANRVLVTTPSTRADLITYAGVPASQVRLIEMDFEPPADVTKDNLALELPERYFLWTTNMAAHKNHLMALNALEKYYQELDGKFDIVVTGVNSEYFDIDREFEDNDPIFAIPHIKEARNRIQKSTSLQKRMHVLGNIPETSYASVVRQCRFLWHPNVYDNGTFSVIEAAYYQHPSLSARYPAMEYINQKFNLNLTFFNPFSSKDMAQSLADMERDYINVQLPSKESLMERSWQANAPALYETIMEVL